MRKEIIANIKELIPKWPSSKVIATKRIIAIIKGLIPEWLFPHIIALPIAISSIVFFNKLIVNWEKEVVVNKVHSISVFLGHYLIWIDTGLTLAIITLIYLTKIIIRHYKKGVMATASGIFFYSPNNSKRTIEKGEKFLKEKSIECTHIYTMGATGWDTFGDQDSPLHESLDSCHETQIILLSPLSDNLKKRAKDVKQDKNKYKNEICKSINYLAALRAKGPNPERIKLKFYTTYPGWKYIFIEPYVWVQYYSLDDHVKNAPVYMYENVTKGIYRNLLDQFSTRWNSRWLWPYNFKTKKIEHIDKNGIIYKHECIEQLLIDAIK